MGLTNKMSTFAEREKINVTEHIEISPNMLDDITYVKHESVTINEDVDLTISSGDFIINR